LRKKILFIINPISGGRDKKKIPGLIEKHLDKNLFDYRISFTEKVEHGFMLAKAAVKDQYEIIVAVGGDGTVNEIAKAIINSKIVLGIIPFGSGNGLARSLKIPLNIIDAIKNINTLNIDTIDSASFNNHFFFNVAGSGFDAHISQSFAHNKIRGLVGYIKTTFKELRNYIPQEYKLNLDGKVYLRKAFIVSIANSSQYGNDAHIAPRADVKDGWLDIVVVKPISWYKIPFLATRMFTKTAESSKYVEMFKAKKIYIEREYDAAIHLDGEPRMEQKNLAIEIIPLSVNIIVPGNVKKK
jgi:YegS/Rv2252/BmrU family lipid kinase